ncbi:MAG: enterochelin esterase [Planctomycetota bacterium]|nr:MAG: enterochelin esterase [Planctomycetota bacterium]
MSSLLDELRRAPPADEAALKTLLGERTPPLPERDGLLFLWYGQADEVLLHHWVAGLESAVPFERLPKSDVWWCRLQLPPRSRIEYKLEIRRGEQHELVRDPANPHLATDPFGANSVAAGEGYERPDFSLEQDGVPSGELLVKDFHSDALGGGRRVTVYTPPHYRESARYPLLVVHDGSDYLRHASLATVLDNLIARLEIPPMIVACVDPGDRLAEYAADPRHDRFIVNELLPALQARFPLVDRPGARGIMGASFGAVATLATAWRHPNVFGRVLLQSGSFAFTDIGKHDKGPLFDAVVEFVNAFRAEPGQFTSRIFVSCGLYERLIYENRSLVPTLTGTGMAVRFEEARDGHNWENWRDRLRTGLSWLFPGPLWMVYE